MSRFITCFEYTGHFLHKYDFLTTDGILYPSTDPFRTHLSNINFDYFDTESYGGIYKLLDSLVTGEVTIKEKWIIGSYPNKKIIKMLPVKDGDQYDCIICYLSIRDRI